MSDVRTDNAGPLQVKQFLRAVYHAANAVAELNGGPLAERRFLLEFPARAQAAERPEFIATLFNLLGASNIETNDIPNWLSHWKTAFLAASENPKVDQRIHSARLNYYEKAIEAVLASETPMASLWMLIHTWTLAANVLDNEQIKPWQAVFENLGLIGNGFEQRVSDLDHFLDEIEIRFDEIASANGLETSSSV